MIEFLSSIIEFLGAIVHCERRVVPFGYSACCFIVQPSKCHRRAVCCCGDMPWLGGPALLCRPLSRSSVRLGFRFRAGPMETRIDHPTCLRWSAINGLLKITLAPVSGLKDRAPPGTRAPRRSVGRAAPRLEAFKAFCLRHRCCCETRWAAPSDVCSCGTIAAWLPPGQQPTPGMGGLQPRPRRAAGPEGPAHRGPACGAAIDE